MGRSESRPRLGRLERVDPREYWGSEPADFTPWLAQHIALLGEAVGLELEVESQERGVGPFRADILCKETPSGHYVLIENQLETTDHLHLGQLMTYAAGLDAVTIVWVAKAFREEHRAALDWLNRMTEDTLNFFGLEIELWRIGESPPAPKFNVVSQPNGWSRAVKASTPGESAEPSEKQQLHLAFWTALKEHLATARSSFRIGTPARDHWRAFGIGRSGFALVLANGMRDGYTSIYLSMTGPDAKAHFFLLRDQHRAGIEAQLGPLDWRELPNYKESQVVLRRHWTPTDRTTWPALCEWSREKLEQWSQVLAPIVRSLDASEHVPADAVAAAVIEEQADPA